ncbi:hypothetical protein FVF58_14845 [Paraburkholderia panacisoli]|uniref:Uncharacterized protein n=1 Tax=Paraburkholderia panacisoli TaxID=2603818 RepID=A0A5B0H9V5_9BURK|nr:hypothetical protein [Paraburkholderia panacisoli]KAA1011763.1 hypothetical protein FVF58_14845 [Paraburkholderia panacisoli]
MTQRRRLLQAARHWALRRCCRGWTLTPADWDVKDFLPGALAPETGKDGKLYGILWDAAQNFTFT